MFGIYHSLPLSFFIAVFIFLLIALMDGFINLFFSLRTRII